MTRPIARIKTILKLIEEAWLKNPDLRLWQLLYNADVGYNTEDLTTLVSNFHNQYWTTKLLWWTYGKSGNEPLEYKRLEELTTPHIYNILMTQWVRDSVKYTLRKELNLRLTKPMTQDEFLELMETIKESFDNSMPKITKLRHHDDPAYTARINF